MTEPVGAARARHADAQLGRVVAERYAIDRVLGRGGMGVVYQATQIVVDRPVALKLIHADRAQNAIASRRFIREARVIARLQHANVVRLIDFGTSQAVSANAPAAFLVMEYVEGRPLTDELQRVGRFGAARVAHVLSQAFSALDEAHSQGIVHRDLKPDNLMLTTVGGDPDFLKILDFGVAAVLDEDAELLGESGGLTNTGVAIGSPMYMAPEQATGADPSPQADMYALGVIGYELLTGAPPFRRKSSSAYMQAHVNSRVPWPEVDGTPLHNPLVNFIMQCLAKAPEDRFPSTAQARRVLAEASAAVAVGVPERPVPARVQPPLPPIPEEPDSGATLDSADSNLGLSSLSAMPVLPAATSTSDRLVVAPEHRLRASDPVLQLPRTDAQDPDRKGGWRLGLATAAVGLMALGGGAWWTSQRATPEPRAVTKTALAPQKLGDRPLSPTLKPARVEAKRGAAVPVPTAEPAEPVAPVEPTPQTPEPRMRELALTVSPADAWVDWGKGKGPLPGQGAKVTWPRAAAPKQVIVGRRGYRTVVRSLSDADWGAGRLHIELTAKPKKPRAKRVKDRGPGDVDPPSNTKRTKRRRDYEASQ